VEEAASPEEEILVPVVSVAALVAAEA